MVAPRVLVITGAGISAESGIPTFRGPGGYWRGRDPSELATPAAFARDPRLVWQWYRERRAAICGARPNPAHEAVVRLARNCSHFLLVTQNVDDLHMRATWDGYQLQKEHIVQIHGDIFVTRCSRCGSQRSANGDETDELPICQSCNALMRPGVVWFGETLNSANIQRVEKYLETQKCDLVIVIGTTALFGYIVDWALRAQAHGGELYEVNPEPTALSQFATRSIRKPAAIALPRIVEGVLAGLRPDV